MLRSLDLPDHRLIFDKEQYFTIIDKTSKITAIYE